MFWFKVSKDFIPLRWAGMMKQPSSWQWECGVEFVHTKGYPESESYDRDQELVEALKAHP